MDDIKVMKYFGEKPVQIANTTFTKGCIATWRHVVVIGFSSIPSEYWEIKLGDSWVEASTFDWAYEI